MTPAYLNLLVDFNYWAHARTLGAAKALSPEQYGRDLGSSFKSVRDTLVHLYSAEWVWYQRWQGERPTVHISPAQFPDVDALRPAWDAHEVKMREFIAGKDQQAVEQIYEYTLFNGTTSASPLWQMVTHVVNHATYHRGQVTTMLRQLGAAPPPSLDLIAYYREKATAYSSRS